MQKRKFKRFIAITMAAMVTLSTNAFATPINLTDTPADASKTDTLDKANGTDYFADEDTNNWQDGSISEEVRVTVDRASRFEITIPKEIVLNGNDGSASYNVSVTGEIAGDQVISVVPDASFTLNEDGGKETPVTVTQNDTDFTYVQLDANTPYSGSLSAPEISAGNWNGSFYFNIEFKASAGPVLPAKAAFNDMSWADIATVSEAGKASEYFAVGDEKELTIGEYSYYDSYYDTTVTHPETTYHVQILGFNHDDKSDGTGKAGITVGLKEMMTITHAMNSTQTNVGGWKDSEMRTYVNGNVYDNLSQEVKDVIKPVNKLTSEGNESTNITTTSDKLFLLSEVEIFGSTTYSASGEGSQYQYFADGGSKIKYESGSSSIWWGRSPRISSTDDFCDVYDDGYAGNDYADSIFGVVFGFSI